MGENSKIEWCDHTVNLWWGCYEVHAGCDHCYAKTFSNRYHGPHLLWQQQGPRMLVKSAFSDLLKYQDRAANENKKYYIFMNSMSDIFEKSMPVVDFNHHPAFTKDDEPMFTENIRSKFFTYVDDCPNLIFLCLTKRPSNILKMIPQTWIDKPRVNVLFGTSIVDQQTANILIPQLLAIPGRHFLSMEPLVGPVELSDVTHRVDAVRILGRPALSGIDWVICGGESGHDARPMNNAWAESIQKQCSAVEIPFFFKQWGEWMPLKHGDFIDYAADGSNRTYYFDQSISHKFLRSNDQLFYNSGKHNSGSLLNGVNYKEMPL